MLGFFLFFFFYRRARRGRERVRRTGDWSCGIVSFAELWVFTSSGVYGEGVCDGGVEGVGGGVLGGCGLFFFLVCINRR